MKVYISGTNDALAEKSIRVKKNLISGDRPYHLEIDRINNELQCIRFIYPEDEPKIKEWDIDEITVRFGPVTGRIYCLGSSKPIPRGMISKKLSACKRTIAKHLKSRDLRTTTNLDFGIKSIRKILNIDNDC